MLSFVNATRCWKELTAMAELRRMTDRCALFAVACLALAGAGVHAATPASIEGRWLTDDRKGVVAIAACGTKVCGRIVQVLDRGPGVPSADVHNPNARLRGRPLVGLLTLWGFRRDGDSWQGGRAYDPKSGKSYRSTLAVERDGSLKVTGCVLIICESRYWTRYR